MPEQAMGTQIINHYIQLDQDELFKNRSIVKSDKLFSPHGQATPASTQIFPSSLRHSSIRTAACKSSPKSWDTVHGNWHFGQQITSPETQAESLQTEYKPKRKRTKVDAQSLESKHNSQMDGHNFEDEQIGQGESSNMNSQRRQNPSPRPTDKQTISVREKINHQKKTSNQLINNGRTGNKQWLNENNLHYYAQGSQLDYATDAKQPTNLDNKEGFTSSVKQSQTVQALMRTIPFSEHLIGTCFDLEANAVELVNMIHRRNTSKDTQESRKSKNSYHSNDVKQNHRSNHQEQMTQPSEQNIENDQQTTQNGINVLLFGSTSASSLSAKKAKVPQLHTRAIKLAANTKEKAKAAVFRLLASQQMTKNTHLLTSDDPLDSEQQYMAASLGPSTDWQALKKNTDGYRLHTAIMQKTLISDKNINKKSLNLATENGSKGAEHHNAYRQPVNYEEALPDQTKDNDNHTFASPRLLEEISRISSTYADEGQSEDELQLNRELTKIL